MFKSIAAATAILGQLIFAQAVEGRTLRLARPPVQDDATKAFLEALVNSRGLAASELKFDVIDSSALAAPRDVPKLVAEGVIEAALVSSSSVLEGGEPQLSHLMLISNPSIVSSAREQFAVEDSVYGAVMAAELGKRNLISVSFWNRSGASIFSKRPVKELADLKGLKLRASDQASARMLAALGAAPAQTAFGEIMPALERGLIDAAEAPLPSNLPLRSSFLSLAKGGTLITNYKQLTGFLVVGMNIWIDLTERERVALQAAARDAQAAARRAVLAEEETLPGLAKDASVQFVNFADIGRGFLATEAPAVWLQGSGEKGQRALDLLTRVKNEIPVRRDPNRGGEVRPVAKPKILFATLRNDDGGSDLTLRFGAKRLTNARLSCGTVAFGTQQDRSVGNPYDGALGLEGSGIVQDAACFKLIDEAAAKASGQLVVFVHGFWYSLDSALRRAIAVATDLEVAVPVLVWSWPSANSASAYRYDEESIEWSRIQFADMIQAFVRSSQVKRLSIISHSMGARLALIALETIPTNRGLLENFVAVAPDVAQSIFAQRVTRYGTIAKRSSLYATSNDIALMISKSWHDEARAGLAGDDLLVIDALETIDATRVESGVINHAHAFEVPEAVADLKMLVAAGLAPQDRKLAPGKKNGKPYWIIRKRGE